MFVIATISGSCYPEEGNFPGDRETSLKSALENRLSSPKLSPKSSSADGRRATEIAESVYRDENVGYITVQRQQPEVQR